MIIRNSIKSVIRSPLKSILFFLLILALVAALSLGSALVSMCSALIRQCDAGYTTIGSIEYRGGRFPEKAVSDAKAASMHTLVDFTALEQLEYVKAIDRSETAIVSLPDFSRVLMENSSSQNVTILVARKLSDDNAMCKVEKVLYSDALSEDRLINLYIYDENGTRLPFNGETGHSYLISGFTDGNLSGVISVYLNNVLNETAYNAGITQESFAIDVTGDKELKNGDPAYAFFEDAAEAYTRINHSWYARISTDPAYLEPFVEKDYSVRDGKLYTQEDAEGRICCLLPDVIADRWEVKPGDEITLIITQTGFASIPDSFWPGVRGLGENEDGGDRGYELKCTLTGIITTTAREVPLIYISSLGNIAGGDGFCGYTLGTLHLKNGITSKEIAEIESLLPDGADLAVYDQGYSGITGSLKRLREDAAGVVIAAGIASLAMLVLFAYVFIGRQSDSVVTMYLMGTKVKDLALYVAVSAAAVLIPGSVAGNILSGSLSNVLAGFISRTVSESQSSLRMYSSSSLGIVEPLDVSVSMPFWPGILCALLLTVTGIAACLVFMQIALKPVSPDAYQEKLSKKANKEKTAKPKNAKPLKLSGAALKYVILSLKRGGIRTWAIPLVSALMAIFVLVPVNTLNSYRDQVRELNENTRIDCYFTDYGGKRRYDLVLMDNMIGALEECEYFEDFHYAACDPYIITYTLTDGEDGGELTRTDYAKEAPSGGFSRESYVANLMNGPKIFYTDKISSAPEFVGKTAPEIRWLDGYGPEYFTEERQAFKLFENGSYGYRGANRYAISDDLREHCAVIPESVAGEHNVTLGDYIGITVTEDLVKEEYKVIGIFHDIGNTGFIYTRMDNVHKLFIVISQRPGFPDGVEKQIKVRTSASCGSFVLTDTAKIREAKEWLWEKGYSRVHTAGFYRLYPIFEDQEYCEALEKLERNIGYLEKILPAMAALVLVTGFAAAYLLMFRRRVEIATLRSIGETSGRVFTIFTAEQILTALIGTALGIGLWIAFAGAGGNAWLAAAFFAGFFVGTIISALRMSRNNLLDVLSDKE